MTDTPLIYLAGCFTVRGIIGTIRDFNKGDVLPVHTHMDESINHLTIVARGSMVCRGRPSIDGKIINAGDVLDWGLGEPHGFEALEDATRIIQMRKV